MKLSLKINPLSVNKAWKGKRYKTDDYKSYEGLVLYEISKVIISTENRFSNTKNELSILYVFYIKNYGNADAGNFEKLISDILVKSGTVTDDRYFKSVTCIKERVDNYTDERIDIYISDYFDIKNIFPQ